MIVSASPLIRSLVKSGSGTPAATPSLPCTSTCGGLPVTNNRSEMPSLLWISAVSNASSSSIGVVFMV